ncbi:uncharacterized protein LOC142348047 [Convolutriloba macropyga]|uniref:uncharacterized protein LOC142348047 n=1 Tax=Convolutriloba macropyga TaxID=536237 RepID=UPI003F524C10
MIIFIRGHSVNIEMRWVISITSFLLLQLCGATFLATIYSFTVLFVISSQQILELLSMILNSNPMEKLSQMIGLLTTTPDFKNEARTRKLRLQRQISASTVKEERLLREDVQKLEGLILRDFVDIWTREICPTNEEAREWIEKAVIKLRSDILERLIEIRLPLLVDLVIQIWSSHLSTYRDIFDQQVFLVKLQPGFHIGLRLFD